MRNVCELLLRQAELQRRGGATNAADETLALMRECQKKAPYCAEWCQTRAQLVMELDQDPRDIIAQARHAVGDLNDVLDSAFKSGYSVQLAVSGVGSGDRAPKVSINGARQLAWALVGGPERRTALHRSGTGPSMSVPAPPKAPDVPTVTAVALVDVSVHSANVQRVALGAISPIGDGGADVTLDERKQLQEAVEGAVAALRKLGSEP